MINCKVKLSSRIKQTIIRTIILSFITNFDNHNEVCKKWKSQNGVYSLDRLYKGVRKNVNRYETSNIVPVMMYLPYRYTIRVHIVHIITADSKSTYLNNEDNMIERTFPCPLWQYKGINFTDISAELDCQSFMKNLHYQILIESAVCNVLEKGVLKNCAIFTGKHLCWSLLLAKL